MSTGLLFENEKFKNDKALSGEFLLGFHVQRLELKKSKEEIIRSRIRKNIQKTQNGT